MKTTEKKVLKFHTGRGGRFYNQGFVRFIGFERIDEGTNFDPYFADDNYGYVNESGNQLDYEINDDGTGYINDDGDYDSTQFVLEDRLTPKQINSIVREIDGVYECEIMEILNNYYSEYLPQIKDHESN